ILNHSSCSSLIVFFFSSRRRHTRSKRDWSSDVCSSDLNKSNNHGVDTLLKTMQLPEFTKGLSFTNLVDFDAMYGHRRDTEGYRDCLEEFDSRLPEIIANMKEDDLLLEIGRAHV